MINESTISQFLPGYLSVENLQIDARLKNVISIYFQLISDDERVFFLEEQVLCPDPLETDGRYFELFGQLFDLYDIEQNIEAHNLIDRDGYATLAYVLSEDEDQLFPVLTNIRH